mgnify:CR=1 FL=1
MPHLLALQHITHHYAHTTAVADATLMLGDAERIALIATGGMSHDPGERGHGWIDTDFDATFIKRMEGADLQALASYRDSEIMAAGAGTAELLAWLCLAGIMGKTQPRLVAYEAVKPWATGIGLMSYTKAA